MILDNYTADCEFYCPGPATVLYTGTKKGRDGIQSYFDALLGTQTDSNLRIDQYVAQGDTVVAIWRYTDIRKYRGRTGRTSINPVRDGKPPIARRYEAVGSTRFCVTWG